MDATRSPGHFTAGEAVPAYSDTRGGAIQSNRLALWVECPMLNYCFIFAKFFQVNGQLLCGYVSHVGGEIKFQEVFKIVSNPQFDSRLNGLRFWLL